MIVCAKRFSYDSSWNPVKLDTKILFPNDDVNAELDFSALITEKDTLFDYFQKNCNAPNAQSENKSNQNQHNNILQPDLNELNDSQLQLFAQLESIGFTVISIKPWVQKKQIIIFKIKDFPKPKQKKYSPKIEQK